MSKLFKKVGGRMGIIFVTGLSGVGKTSVLQRLENEGYDVVDTDNHGYTKKVPTVEGEEFVWDEEKISHLIERRKRPHIVLSGCYSNQGEFYQSFDYVVLLEAPLDVMLDRVNQRNTNPYGKHPDERKAILESFTHVLPKLRASANVVIDTSKVGISETADRLKSLMIMAHQVRI
ncbi:AAA family ATPase [Halobacillus sp. Nhm2S1]|uniref:AAA family ATPase n=1 Tax=Halobacillus sp. Nhm2S1 TaxID=2866716 RepID=UPI001C72DBA2|nr:AAA family ATPase [Halobacillus sp. Nhm2S1]MBX0358626.1 AAA family ATPase [Halobacillus sp. Nhm2S1]